MWSLLPKYDRKRRTLQTYQNPTTIDRHHEGEMEDVWTRTTNEREHSSQESHEMVLLGSNGRRDSKVQRKEEGDNRDNIKQRHRTYTTTQHKLYTTKTYIGVASAKH